jgi:hypothetical protein
LLGQSWVRGREVSVHGTDNWAGGIGDGVLVVGVLEGGARRSVLRVSSVRNAGARVVHDVSMMFDLGVGHWASCFTGIIGDRWVIWRKYVGGGSDNLCDVRRRSWLWGRHDTWLTWADCGRHDGIVTKVLSVWESGITDLKTTLEVVVEERKSGDEREKVGESYCKRPRGATSKLMSLR